MMTREDKLYSMKGDMLIKEADKLGVKVACNKNRTQLKESKQNVIDRILAFEASQIKEVEEDVTVEHKLVPMLGIEKLEELKKEYSHEEDVIVDKVVETVVDNESELTDEEYAKIGLEIAEQAKEKARKHKNNKVDNSDKLYELELLLNNLDSKYYESVKCYKIKAEGKTIAEVYPQKKGIRVYVHKDYDISNVCVIKDNYKYYLPVAVNFDYDNIAKVIEFLNRK